MPLIKDITDTARLVATYRAHESQRADAVFVDPLAARLAGERGARIAAAMSFAGENSWSFTARTWLFDGFVRQQVDKGIDLVVCLAAGLDARPYRMDLPASLRWIEVDLPAIFDYKDDVLRGEKPRCDLQRVRVDLTDSQARGQFLQSLTGTGGLVLTEGLLGYLQTPEVRALSTDLAAVPALHTWALDLMSPGLLKMLQQFLNPQFEVGVPPLHFAPRQGPAFFAEQGWRPLEVGSFLKTAAQLNRLPPQLQLLAQQPEDPEHRPDQPWAGVCLFAKA